MNRKLITEKMGMNLVAGVPACYKVFPLGDVLVRR